MKYGNLDVNISTPPEILTKEKAIQLNKSPPLL
jgi:hypothetical protein